MIRARLVLSVLFVAVGLAACGEKAQTATAGKKKADDKPWENTTGRNVVGNWKSGDEKAWEAQLRARAEGQNEYARSTSSTSNP